MSVRLDRQIKRVFDSLVDLPADQQLAALAALPPEVRHGVEQLLSLDSPAEGFLLPLPHRYGLRAPELAEEPEPVNPGTLLNDRYLVERYYRSGGFSTIYLARDQRLWNKQVVVKVLDRLKGTQLQVGLDSEIRALSQISHPNVVAIYDHGWLDSGAPFLVMPYVPGLTLAEVVASGTLAPERALNILREVCLAIGAAHQQGVWHLDVKAQNVMLSQPGTPGEKVNLVDFGIARVRESAGFLHAGSAGYMAPEQQQGQPEARSDIYALAVLGCFMLTGRAIRTPGEAVKALRKLPPTAREAILQALEPEPSERPATAEIFAEALAGGRPWWQQAWVAGVAVVAVAILLMVIRLFEALGQPGVPVHAAPVPFTHEAGLEMQPAFSPDGELIYYAAGASEDEADLWVKGTSGSARQLTTGHHGDIKPVVSGDGRKVAFLRNNGSNGRDLMVMEADGSNLETVIRQAQLLDVDWGPKDEVLIYSEVVKSPDRRDFSRLAAIRLKQRKSWTITTPPKESRGDHHPRYSAAQQALVFCRYQTREASDLWVQPLTAQGEAAGAPWRLTFELQRAGWPNWTPDGREVIYLSGTLIRRSLRRVTAQPSSIPAAASAVTMAEVTTPRAAWKLAFVRDTSDVNIRQLRKRGSKWEDAGILGGSSFTDEEARISPDGKTAAFVSDRSGREQVWLTPLDSTGASAESQRQLTFLDRSDRLFVCWMPNGQQLLVSTRDAAQGASTFLIPRDGGQPRYVSQEVGVAASHDGSSIYVRSDRTGRPEVWKLHLDTGVQTQITRGGSTGGIESADGRYFYFDSPERLGVWRVPLPSGPEQQVVTEQLARRNLYAVSSSGLYYIVRGKPSHVRFQPLDGTRPATLWSVAPTLFWGFDISRDEQSMLLSQLDVENSDIMLIPNFH